VPQFCEDILCIFVNIKPGRAFALAPQEIPACIECIIEKGYEVLTTLDAGGVGAPQESSNQRFVIPNFLALFGKSTPKVHVITKSLPDPKSSPEKERPLTEVFDEPNNYDLADMILNYDCQAVIDLLPDGAVVSNQEVVKWCAEYKKNPPDIKNTIPEQLGKLSTAEHFSASNLRDEFTTTLHKYLNDFRKSIVDFSNSAQFTGKQIKAVDISCPANL